MYLFGKTRTVPMQLGKYYQLGYYRPSQAYDRSIVRGRTSLRRSADLRGLRGLGDATTTANDILSAATPAATPSFSLTDPTTLLLIGGVGLGAYMLLRRKGPSSGGGSTKQKIARLAAQRATASAKLRDLEL